MKDLYSVTLSPEQVKTACEEYVLRKTNDEKLGASCDGETEAIMVRVFVKRIRKPKATA